MERRLVVLGVAGMLAFLALSAWLDLNGWFDKHPTPSTPAASASSSASATASAPEPSATASNASSLVDQNRSDRTGPSWSPASPTGPDGKPLKFGHVVPGAFEPVKAGTAVQSAVDAGYLARDTKREQSCQGDFWRWTGQLSGGLDVLVGTDGKITSLGMSKAGLETPEGISIGNSFAALEKTYGDALSDPVRTDYGQAGVFLQKGDDWIGFLFDNKPGQLADDSHIVFIEVSHGQRPALLRDGC